MKVLIIDDNPEMREMMRSFLPKPFVAVCECEDGFDALDYYQSFLPDWVLMDWKMKQMDGITATRQIIGSFPEAKIVLVTQHDDRELRAAALEAGACGFVSKDELIELRGFFPLGFKNEGDGIQFVKTGK